MPADAGAARPLRFCFPSVCQGGEQDDRGDADRSGSSLVEDVKRTIEAEGLEAYVMLGEERIVIGVVGAGVERVEHVASMPGVEQVMRVSKPYKLASNEHHPDRTRVKVRNVVIGARRAHRGHGRTVRRGVTGAARRHGSLGQARGRHHPAWRRVQAPQLPIRLPGTRRSRD